MSDYEQRAQWDAETALEKLWMAEADNGECACNTCIVREVLEAAWPHLRGLAIEEYEEINGE